LVFSLSRPDFPLILKLLLRPLRQSCYESSVLALPTSPTHQVSYTPPFSYLSKKPEKAFSSALMKRFHRPALPGVLQSQVWVGGVLPWLCTPSFSRPTFLCFKATFRVSLSFPKTASLHWRAPLVISQTFFLPFFSAIFQSRRLRCCPPLLLAPVRRHRFSSSFASFLLTNAVVSHLKAKPDYEPLVRLAISPSQNGFPFFPPPYQSTGMLLVFHLSPDDPCGVHPVTPPYPCSVVFSHAVEPSHGRLEVAALSPWGSSGSADYCHFDSFSSLSCYAVGLTGQIFAFPFVCLLVPSLKEARLLPFYPFDETFEQATLFTVFFPFPPERQTNASDRPSFFLSGIFLPSSSYFLMK